MAEKINFGKYDYQIINMNLLQLQVCSDCPPESMVELEGAVRTSSPSGTEGNWCIEEEGEYAPVKCANGGGRWHYIFQC